MKPRLLLQVCCAPCFIYPYTILQEQYEVTIYYYNPNIFPFDEFKNRYYELSAYCEKNNIKLIVFAYNHEKWLKRISGYEQEPEKGKRCLICYEDRLEQTAIFAKEDNFNAFGTVLTISPHKLAEEINKIGNKLMNKYQIKYLEANFKKNDGFKKSCLLAKKEGFYRQNYCWCEFSIRKNKKK